MTDGQKQKKPPGVFPGGSLVVFGHDWSRPLQRAHHQIAMFKDLFMGGIVSVRSRNAQEAIPGMKRAARMPPLMLDRSD
jgi:hypothetical protein